MHAGTQKPLACFQDAFARAPFAPGDPPPAEVAALVAQPGFAVYRNTVMKGCIDALQANYHAVARLLGEEWFRAAAAAYVRQAPPVAPMLGEYGAAFADFLARFGPAAELPYLPGVARLDRCWTEAHAAPDADVIDPAAIGRLAPQRLAAVVLHPHPAARWAWFPDAPIYTVWARNRSAQPQADEIEWRAEGALLTRPRGAVQWQPLDRAGCAFLDVCAAGGTVTACAQAALEVRENADLARLMATLLEAGAVSRMSCDDC
jgi:hypothetical protein